MSVIGVPASAFETFAGSHYGSRSVCAARMVSGRVAADRPSRSTCSVILAAWLAASWVLAKGHVVPLPLVRSALATVEGAARAQSDADSPAELAPDDRVPTFLSLPRGVVIIMVFFVRIGMNISTLVLLAVAGVSTNAHPADAAANGKPPAVSSSGIRVVFQGNELKPPARIYFATNSDTLLSESEPALQRMQALLTERPDISLLRIEVHSDPRGAHAYNQALTEKRSLALAHALVARGVDCRRLLPVGFGETRPIVPNNSADFVEATRRVSLVVVAQQGHPVGALSTDGGGHSAGDPCR